MLSEHFTSFIKYYYTCIYIECIVSLSDCYYIHIISIYDHHSILLQLQIFMVIKALNKEEI